MKIAERAPYLSAELSDKRRMYIYIPGLPNVVVRPVYLGDKVQSIKVYGYVDGLYVSPKDDALKHPKPCGKWCAGLPTDVAAVRKFVTYAGKLQKYIDAGGALWAEHHKPAGGGQQFEDAPAHIVTADYTADSSGCYAVKPARELAGQECPMCPMNHARVAHHLVPDFSRIDTTANSPAIEAGQKEETEMKKYTAVEIKGNTITYLGMFDTLPAAKKRAGDVAGTDVRKALHPYDIPGGIVLAGARSELLKRHDRGDYASADVSPVVEPAPVEVVAPEPAPVEAVAPGAVARVIDSGEGLNIKDRAALITPALIEARQQETHPVFLKLSHYIASNRVHIAVTGETLRPVAIDAGGVVCDIAGVEPVVIGEDMGGAAGRLLKVMRPVNKAVNAGVAVLAPSGVVATRETVAV